MHGRPHQRDCKPVPTFSTRNSHADSKKPCHYQMATPWRGTSTCQSLTSPAILRTITTATINLCVIPYHSHPPPTSRPTARRAAVPAAPGFDSGWPHPALTPSGQFAGAPVQNPYKPSGFLLRFTAAHLAAPPHREEPRAPASGIIFVPHIMPPAPQDSRRVRVRDCASGGSFVSSPSHARAATSGDGGSRAPIGFASAKSVRKRPCRTRRKGGGASCKKGQAFSANNNGVQNSDHECSWTLLSLAMASSRSRSRYK